MATVTTSVRVGSRVYGSAGYEDRIRRPVWLGQAPTQGPTLTEEQFRELQAACSATPPQTRQRFACMVMQAQQRFGMSTDQARAAVSNAIRQYGPGPGPKQEELPPPTYEPPPELPTYEPPPPTYEPPPVPELPPPPEMDLEPLPEKKKIWPWLAAGGGVAAIVIFWLAWRRRR